MPGYPAPYGTLPVGAAPYAAPTAQRMACIAVLSPQESDLATIAAGSEVASLPAANLQGQQPKKVWRSTATSDYINLTFAEPVAANMLAISGHNFSDVAVYRVRGGASLGTITTAPAVDTGWQSVWPASGKPAVKNWPRHLSALMWSNDSAYLCWRVDVADPSAAQTYIEAGRLGLGRYWQPTINFDLAGTPLGRDQRDVQTVTDYGEIFTDRRNVSAPRRFSLAMSGNDKREVLDGIQEIQRLRGMWGDAFVLLDPNAATDFHRLSLQGVFASPQEHQIVPQFTEAGEMWTVNLPLREVT